MSDSKNYVAWMSGTSYERYIGRWSRLVAQEFLNKLAIPPGGQWLDVGCGTGALSQTILAVAGPAAVKGFDFSPGYVAFAQKLIGDPRASFEVADAQNLPVETGAWDAAVSGLVLNFVADPTRMIAEMARSVRADGVVAVYVWDYASRMELMRYFWDAAVTLNPSVQSLDEGVRFAICNPKPLDTLFRDAGLKNIGAWAIDILTPFHDFNDYWLPFLGGQGPAPGYVMSLNDHDRNLLRERICEALPVRSDGSIQLMARAWAVCGSNA